MMMMMMVRLIGVSRRWLVARRMSPIVDALLGAYKLVSLDQIDNPRTDSSTGQLLTSGLASPVPLS